jgi:hypothetical protein
MRNAGLFSALQFWNAIIKKAIRQLADRLNL